MKRIKFSVLFLVIVLSLGSCRSFREMRSLTKCKFRIATVKNIELAGVNIQNVRRFSDLGIRDAARATTALISGNLGLSMLINVEVKNPNKTTAAMNRLEWIA